MSVVFTKIVLYFLKGFWLWLVRTRSRYQVQHNLTDCSLVYCPNCRLFHWPITCCAFCNNWPMSFPVWAIRRPARGGSFQPFLFHDASVINLNMLDSELCNKMIFMVIFCVVFHVDNEKKLKVKKNMFITMTTGTIYLCVLWVDVAHSTCHLFTLKLKKKTPISREIHFVCLLSYWVLKKCHIKL